MEEYELTADESGERIDKFLSRNCEKLSRSYIQKLLKDGNIIVNKLADEQNKKNCKRK